MTLKLMLMLCSRSQVIELTEELLATAKQNEHSGLVAQRDADVSPGQEPFAGTLQLNTVSFSNLKIEYYLVRQSISVRVYAKHIST